LDSVSTDMWPMILTVLAVLKDCSGSRAVTYN